MPRTGFIKFASIYLGIFLLIHFGIFFLIKNQQKNFSQASLNQLIYTVSTSRPRTDNPCLRTFAQEPYTQNYYKIYIYCNQNPDAATNTIDLDAVPDKTIRGVITEFARIMNFDPQLLLRSGCYSAENGKNIDLNSIAVSKDTIKCNFNSQK